MPMKKRTQLPIPFTRHVTLVDENDFPVSDEEEVKMLAEAHGDEVIYLHPASNELRIPVTQSGPVKTLTAVFADAAGKEMFRYQVLKPNGGYYALTSREVITFEPGTYRHRSQL